MIKRLQYVDGETLANTIIPPIRFVIHELLPQGLHVLAGAPKVGKSWLSLWICLCVAQGEKLWDFPTQKGSVLYLCLEDSYARIQNRLLDLTDDAPGNLFFSILSEKLHEGLEEQLESFLAEHPDTVLVVIDTLQRVRNPMKDGNPYASDYRDLEALKQLADRRGVALLLIHHLRKMNDEDPMNMISGTTGISGATDGNFVLRKDKRSTNTATLFCTGRDIPYRELSLTFDENTHRWELREDSQEPLPEQKTDPLVENLLSFLEQHGDFTGTATELAAAIADLSGEMIQPNVLIKKLIRRQQELSQLGISLSSRRTHTRRELSLTMVRVGCVSNDGKTDSLPVSDFPSQPSQLSQTNQQEVSQ